LAGSFSTISLVERLMKVLGVTGGSSLVLLALGYWSLGLPGSKVVVWPSCAFPYDVPDELRAAYLSSMIYVGANTLQA